MSALDASRFGEFFRALHGENRSPFPWQQRLAERVCEGDWPAYLAVPTAAGKTACIDIALYALACQGERRGRTAPRRIFFVVDRRIIVDQAFERTQKIADQLQKRKVGILREVADRLRELARSDCPVECFQLRGGIYRDDSWVRSPLQPTVVASTVDQIGSRLLFRGYGLRSGLARPIHAALTGIDSLILLDEAHCSRAFACTAEAVRKYRGWGTGPLETPFRFVQLTATPPEVDETQVVRDTADDRAHPVLGARIAASKPAKLVIAEKARGKEWRRHLVDTLLEQCQELLETGTRSLAVIVNRVATAREVCQRLRAGHGDLEVELLTGRMRPLDRDRLAVVTLARVASGAEASFEKPLVVVATQCLEVGADLDFQGLVVECASLDALRQRFGRLDRLGKWKRAAGRIVIRADQVSDLDPIYGDGLSATWSQLKAWAIGDQVDMGIEALRQRLEGISSEDLSKLNAPSPAAPVLLPAHLDCWVQTAPVPSPDPDPAVFLHGPQEGAPDVQVVWRVDLPIEESELWKQIVSLCPPSSSEAMPVPIYAFRRWMVEQGRTDESGDVEGSDEYEETAENSRIKVLRWCGPDNAETTAIEHTAGIRPGDTLVVPVQSGGWDHLGHVPVDEQREATLIDLGEQAYALSRNYPLLRLTEEVLKSWQVDTKVEPWKELLEGQAARDDEDVRNELVEQCLECLLASCDTRLWLSQSAERLLNSSRTVEEHPAGGWVVRGKAMFSRERPLASFTDEDDTSSRQEAGEPVLLPDHCLGVEKRARQLAQGVGLPEGVIETLAWAARWHDLGKADPRFQAWLWNVPRWALRQRQLLAKSARMPRSAMERQKARERAGYPTGGRHELLSVRLAETKLDSLPPLVDSELLLYLIGCHHGHCRPFAPVVEDETPERVPAFDHLGCLFPAITTKTDLERLDSGAAERFWKLVRRFGWWGLAYLEAVLRLADHRQSEAEGQKSERKSRGE